MDQTENVLSQEEQTLINQIVLGQPKYSGIKDDANMVAIGYLHGKKSILSNTTVVETPSSVNLNAEFNKIQELYEQKESYTEEIELPSFLLSNISKTLIKISAATNRKDEEGFNLDAVIAKELENFSKTVIRTVKYTITEQN